jgi:hypothetical protein
MPNWLLKSAIQRVISILPHRQRWNELFQTLGTRSLDLTAAKFESRLEHTRRHLDNFVLTQSGSVRQFTAFELGTGWFPTMVIGMYVRGAGPIWTVDIDTLLRSARLELVLRFFCDYDDRKELDKHLPGIHHDRMQQLREALSFVGRESPEAVLERMNIRVMVRDAQDTGLPENSVDLFFSTGVLEYIPKPVLEGIFAEFRRIGTARAAMSHWISMVDQFSYFDRSITPFNYMRYTANQWRYLNSPMIWQNRLRISDYRELMTNGGFEIVHEEDEPGSASDLDRIRLAPQFQHYSREDLLVLKSWITARRRC